jgi:hypothetical protein
MDLQKKIKEKGLSNRVFPQKGDMASLPFKPQFFDIIWAEGSIYIIGFEKGLMDWRPYLKSKGYIAVTEISWLKKNPPMELSKFWNEAYPCMRDRNGNISLIERSDYELIDHFVLPANAWLDNYYNPIEKKLATLRLKYKNDSQSLEVIQNEQREIDLFRKYNDYYGYVFYIMQK